MRPVLGIHHVTAISANIEKNLDFYTGVMGFRLVKKSINQDDVQAYHLFYADAVGSPGTDFTFFDWPNSGETRPGAGTVGLTSLRVNPESFDFWEERLKAVDAFVDREEIRILASDPEGQRLALVSNEGFPGEIVPWDKSVPAEHALQGILGVDLDSANPQATAATLVQMLGFAQVDDDVFEVRTEDSVAQVRVTGSAQRGFSGAGGVHHVAFRAVDDDHMREIQERLEGVGFRTSGYVDRYYFHSLYFREPGGVLFEIATDGPGMHIDEPLESLGEKVSIPPFMADRREAIEAGLRPLPAPSYGSK